MHSIREVWFNDTHPAGNMEDGNAEWWLGNYRIWKKCWYEPLSSVRKIRREIRHALFQKFRKNKRTSRRQVNWSSALKRINWVLDQISCLIRKRTWRAYPDHGQHPRVKDIFRLFHPHWRSTIFFRAIIECWLYTAFTCHVEKTWVWSAWIKKHFEPLFRLQISPT